MRSKLSSLGMSVDLDTDGDGFDTTEAKLAGSFDPKSVLAYRAVGSAIEGAIAGQKSGIVSLTTTAPGWRLVMVMARVGSRFSIGRVRLAIGKAHSRLQLRWTHGEKSNLRRRLIRGSIYGFGELSQRANASANR